MKELSNLQNFIDEVGEAYPDSIIFVRGDANASVIARDNNKRDILFNCLIEDNNFRSVPTNHNTYHHFNNNGMSDSSIDVILFSKVTAEGVPGNITETIKNILCSKTNHLIDSSHDALLSTMVLPFCPTSVITSNNTIEAPRVSHSKFKILWTDEGILNYSNLLSGALPLLQSDYSGTTNTEVASVLFRVTNHILLEASKATNKSVELGKAPKEKKPFVPPEIKSALKEKEKALKFLNDTKQNPLTTPTEMKDATTKLKSAKALHQSLTRKHKVSIESDRDNHLLQLLSKQPKEIFKSFKSSRSSQSQKLKLLHVEENVYSDEKVADGFFQSISELKTLPETTATNFERFAEDHRHIVEICKEGAPKIPKITFEAAESLLRKIRPNVSDIFSITAAHYINGGVAAIRHFQFLINTVLETIEMSSMEELNKVHAVILHKGHKKPKHLSTSYRTISSCPFTAKAVDIYLGNLSREDWRSCQASTQFQGSGMSHELASLLLTCGIQNSLASEKPLFVLLLDAKSAFDLVLREILVRRLYLDSAPDQRVRFWDLRLANRTTFCQWEEDLMGPIKDQLGVEQGGPNSSEYYKIYNNEQLTTAQRSGLGITIAGHPVASVGQADDTALISHDIHHLQCLLDLSLLYCQKHQVQLSAGKTKLLVFSKDDSDSLKYVKALSPIRIGDTRIEFVDTAEHVGVLRSTSGNLPHIHQRIVNHKKSLAQILCMGLSRRHRANPVAALGAENIFSMPVLYSGIASLYLKKPEIATLAQHVKETIQSILKLHSKTPEPVIFFLAGRLPGEAVLHLRQLSLFGMISRLPDNILHKIAKDILTTTTQTSKNWFANIRELCFKYNLPHPLLLLKNPPSKLTFKTLCKKNITDFWQSELRVRSGSLKSLQYFKPQFMSLNRPHPLLTWATDSYKVNKCITVMRLLSGRFRCGSLIRHFYPNITTGLCELCGTEVEDIPHIILPKCTALKDRAESLLIFAKNTLALSQTTSTILHNVLNSEDDILKTQFFLDPTVLPDVIQAYQQDKSTLNSILSVTTTWCYSLTRHRNKLLGR